MSQRYPLELRERAVRLVVESRAQYESEWAAIASIATKLGIGSSETLRKWVRKAEVDAGVRPGVTSQESAEMRRLRAEVAHSSRVEQVRTVNTHPPPGSGANVMGLRPRRGAHRFPAGCGVLPCDRARRSE